MASFFCHPFFSTDFLLNSYVYCLLLGIQSTHFLNTASVLQLQLFILAGSIWSSLNQRKSSLHKANIVSSSPNSSYYNLPCKRLPCERMLDVFSFVYWGSMIINIYAFPCYWRPSRPGTYSHSVIKISNTTLTPKIDLKSNHTTHEVSILIYFQSTYFFKKLL